MRIYLINYKINITLYYMREVLIMNDTQQLGDALWSIANKLRGAMNADDFRDYMLSFLF